MELSAAKVQRAIARGVSVYQGDIDEALADYPDGTFDTIILSQTLQETQRPLLVLKEMLRVGKTAIVAFPQFRLPLARQGVAPVQWTGSEDGLVPVRLAQLAEPALFDGPGFRNAGHGARLAGRSAYLSCGPTAGRVWRRT